MFRTDRRIPYLMHKNQHGKVIGFPTKQATDNIQPTEEKYGQKLLG